MMAKYTSTYPGTLITPDGKSIEHGDSIDVTDADAKASGFAVWIEKGWIAKETQKGGSKASKADEE